MANEAIDNGAINVAPQDQIPAVADDVRAVDVTPVHEENNLHASTISSSAGTGLEHVGENLPINTVDGKSPIGTSIPEKANTSDAGYFEKHMKEKNALTEAYQANKTTQTRGFLGIFKNPFRKSEKPKGELPNAA